MKKSVLNNRRKVADYLRKIDVRPLKFDGYTSSKNEFNPANHSIVKMIRRVLILKDDYASINAITNQYETRPAAHRSVIDIWRHIRYYYPTISIFEVMRNMHKVKGLKGHYCPTVCRQVFSLNRRYIDLYTGELTEFDIMFYVWKRL